MERSQAQVIADLPDDERAEVLEGVDPEQLLFDANFWLRPAQMEPEGDWDLWGIISGRGFGKTRAGAEWVRKKANEEPGCRIALVGRTSADVRSVIIGGDSGILSVCPPSERPEYKPSVRTLVFPNGTICETFSSEEPNQLRGPQFHFGWGDEVAAWDFKPDDSGLTAWDNLRIATRLGERPKVIATTTPKKTPFMEDLEKLADENRAVITRGSTFDNLANLSIKYLQMLKDLYQGTRLEMQELMGILLDTVEGALWTADLIELSRHTGPFKVPQLRVVAVDPSVAENPKDECGIVIVGSTASKRLAMREAWVIEDASVHGAPAEWAKVVVEKAKQYACPVVAETNQGAALVKTVIQNIDPTIRVIEVHAAVGKQLRAEPISLAYDQRRVHHINYLPKLEAQMTSWVPGETKKSPDRIDALVHGLTALLIKPPPGLRGGGFTASSNSDRRIPSGRGTGVSTRRVATGGRRAA